MGTYRTYFRSLFADMDMSAVGALPDHIPSLENTRPFSTFSRSFKYLSHVLSQFSNFLKQIGNMVKTFLSGDFGEIGVHICPFIVFTCRCRFQVCRGIVNAIEKFKPDLSMLFFIVGRPLKKGRDLLITFLFCLCWRKIVYLFLASDSPEKAVRKFASVLDPF